MDPSIQALLLAALPIALSVYTLWQQRRKQQAEVEISLSGATMGIVERLEKQLAAQDDKLNTLTQQVANLTGEVLTLHRMNDRLRGILEEWRRGIRILLEQLAESNQKPRWRPSKEDEKDIE